MSVDKIVKILFQNQDLKYRDFHSSLVPNVEKERFIGVRTPVLRKLAKEKVKDGSYKDFIKELCFVAILLSKARPRLSIP